MITTSRCNEALAWFRWIFVTPQLAWFLIFAAAIAILVLWTCSELAFRSYGFGLQVVGVFLAAHEVFSNERLFDQPRIRDRASAWWRSRPSGKTVTGLGSAAIASPAVLGRLTQWEPKVDTDTLAEQVAKLWKNIELISADASGLAADVDQNKRTIEEALKSERQAREAALGSLKELFKEATVGSPLLAYFGAILLLMGSAITTYSELLHKLIS